MQSETAEMLFNDEFILWWNGPVYLAELYEKRDDFEKVVNAECERTKCLA